MKDCTVHLIIGYKSLTQFQLPRKYFFLNDVHKIFAIFQHIYVLLHIILFFLFLFPEIDHGFQINFKYLPM